MQQSFRYNRAACHDERGVAGAHWGLADREQTTAVRRALTWPVHVRSRFRGCNGATWERSVRVPAFAYRKAMMHRAPRRQRSSGMMGYQTPTIERIDAEQMRFIVNVRSLGH